MRKPLKIKLARSLIAFGHWVGCSIVRLGFRMQGPRVLEFSLADLIEEIRQYEAGADAQLPAQGIFIEDDLNDLITGYREFLARIDRLEMPGMDTHALKAG